MGYIRTKLLYPIVVLAAGSCLASDPFVTKFIPLLKAEAGLGRGDYANSAALKAEFGDGSKYRQAIVRALSSGDIVGRRDALEAMKILVANPNSDYTESVIKALERIPDHAMYMQIELMYFRTMEEHGVGLYAADGQLAKLRDLLKSKISPNGRHLGIYRCTALTLAAANGEVEAVKILLSADADVNIASNFGVTPLLAAAWAGEESTVALLLDNGANVLAQSIEGYSVLNPPRVSWPLGYFEIEVGTDISVQVPSNALVDRLFRAGASLDSADREGNTGLHKMAMAGSASGTEHFLELGAGVDPLNREGLGPIEVALEQYNVTSPLLLSFLKRGVRLSPKRMDMLRNAPRGAREDEHAWEEVARYIK